MHDSRLAVFDIDGTLTDTTAVDDECYRIALARAFAVAPAAIEWADAPHMTDTGIATWLWRRFRGRVPSPHELEEVRDQFIQELGGRHAAAPARFRPISGAVTALRHLADAGWHMAIATGGWSQSARLKLRAAEICIDHIAFASADDAPDRVGIVRAAMSRASATHARERIVSIGDGEWDVACARELGVAFVGVGSGSRARRLRAAGASHVVPDYRDIDQFDTALEQATVPGAAAPAV